MSAQDKSGNKNVTLATVLNKGIDSIATYPGGTSPTAITASQLIITGSGQVAGIFVSAASATPTIKVWNNTAGSGTYVIDTFTPVAGTFYEFRNAIFTTGCYVTISGTVSATVFTSPTVNSL